MPHHQFMFWEYGEKYYRHVEYSLRQIIISYEEWMDFEA